ncbi:SnoaL-like domain-containing protein [Asanoa hainanensis]|uniref:SnoaL-like domain-containing protein n=1 Tax=Asanoa hainanensis TaxID=560556 RepID=A0A239M4Z0_9ACTN|nr:nuclear transport factor 2 family protein [Asanoa hainanensis]SNT37766.1 SnoaL-like domain-containing protein [Asanoa hainanensis]
MTSSPLQIALSHHRAWTSKDLAAAMAYVADDVVLDAPAGRLTGIEAYRQFLRPFAEQFLVRAELIAAFGDETTALIMYDTETIPAASAPAAECVTIRAGKIVHNRFVFDRLPFEEFRRRQAAGEAPRLP